MYTDSYVMGELGGLRSRELRREVSEYRLAARIRHGRSGRRVRKFRVELRER